VIVAAGYIGDERAEHIEWCLTAGTLLQEDVRFYLIERDMSRPFYYDLDPALPRTFDEFSDDEQFLYLGTI